MNSRPAIVSLRILALIGLVLDLAVAGFSSVPDPRWLDLRLLLDAAMVAALFFPRRSVWHGLVALYSFGILSRAPALVLSLTGMVPLTMSPGLTAVMFTHFLIAAASVILLLRSQARAGFGCEPEA